MLDRRNGQIIFEGTRRTGERKYLVLPLDPAARRGFFQMPQADAHHSAPLCVVMRLSASRCEIAKRFQETYS
jgi:hypothetical protein